MENDPSGHPELEAHLVAQEPELLLLTSGDLKELAVSRKVRSMVSAARYTRGEIDIEEVIVDSMATGNTESLLSEDQRKLVEELAQEIFDDMDIDAE